MADSSSKADKSRGSAASIPKVDPLIGTEIDDYRITRLLGVGGMAHVYEAQHQTLDRRVALKLLSDQHGDDPELAQRFRREARTLARLEHPRIVTLYEVGETANSYYIAMRFIDGQTLTSVLKQLAKKRQHMPFDEVLTIITDVAEALDYAHTQGVIHRDVKPSNIMLTDDGHAILTDFGLMMQTQENSTQGTAFGTPRYIAPEQAIASQRAVPQSDIYSLGIVLYEMLVGQTPFDHESPMSLALSHITNAPPPPRTIRPDLPPEIERVVLKSIEKQPQDRYATGKALVDDLRAALSLPSLPADLASRRVSSTRPKPSPAKAAADKIAQDKHDKEAAIITLPTPSEGSTTRFEHLSDKHLPLVRAIKPRARWLAVLVGLLLTIGMVGLVVITAQTLMAITTPVIVAADATETPIPPRLRLVYSQNWLAIYNPTTQAAALHGLVLTRGSMTLDPGHEAGGLALDNVGPNQCIEIRLQGNDKTEPLMCATSHNIYFADPNARVWLPDAAGTQSTFVIKRAQTVLQTCLIALNTCEFSAP